MDAPCVLPPSVIRGADPAELARVNEIVAAAVLDWPLHERVRRLAVPVLQYDAVEFADYHVLVHEVGHELTGVAVLDASPPADIRRGHACTLHGIYVSPQEQRQGVGRGLVDAAATLARELGFDGMGVRAERVSTGFFDRCGFGHIAPGPDCVYPHFYWLPLASPAHVG
ncbi:MAG: GNAT family N-acetyltransferase [Gammaproteobacteria bacterium]